MQSDGDYGKINNDYMVNDTTIINRFIAFKNPFRYRSYYYDFETNLYYLNTRYYDPETGRFINADDVSNLASDTLNGLNLYAYCINNPVNLVDENGTSWKSFWRKVKRTFKKVGKAIKNFFEEAWEVVVGSIISIGMVVAGAFLSFIPQLGATLIGAGIGSFVGGLKSKLSGGSFWSGYVGGAISGAFTGLSLTFMNPVLRFSIAAFGSALGTYVTDAMNGKSQNSVSYWLGLVGGSVLSGFISLKIGGLVDTYDIFKSIALVGISAAIVIGNEIAVSFLSDIVLEVMKKIFKDIKTT